MILNFKGGLFTAEGLDAGLRKLSPEYGFTPVFDAAGGDYAVTASHGAEHMLRVSAAGKEIAIEFDKKIHFFRAFGLMLEKLAAGEETFSVEEEVYFDTNGPMFDVSQGSACINLPTLFGFIRRMALMGLNMLMLYCEDNYVVPEEPFFGYMRSKYTEDDMKALDDYAWTFGIEMIPCIQTLSHLHEPLRWPVYNGIKDYSECLLVGEEKTYEFIRHLLTAASRPFRTKRIHIGMDEAWQLGQGRYLIKNGWVPRDEIMKQHLTRVMEIINELGLEPMMWGDMFFNNPQSNSYYNTDPVRPDAIASMPKGMRLVYWDYYHLDKEFYLDYIDKHRLFCEPLFAGGIWTWNGFGANWAKTYETTNLALSACKEKNLREVFATIWGDCDTECDINATLLGLQLFAEHGYSADTPTVDTLRRRFEFIVQANYDDFFALQYIDHMGEDAASDKSGSNPAKCLLWQDILCGLFDRNIEGQPYEEHYARLAVYFRNAVGRNGRYDFVMDYYAKLCDALALKAMMGVKLTNAYKANDRKRLEDMIKNELPELKRRVTALRDCHREVWLRNNKPLGWATFDSRYGTILTRIDSAIYEIGLYLDGKLDTLAELDEPRLPYNGSDSPRFYSNYYDKIAFASRISW